ncbi:uncharacterized protein PG998_004953 [Apiospora kogelbergensis]|uniref:uncharacterized protein n=1 Tax=Apiospora kogelbergensis TaxID=1337665 RepID=UPI00312ED1E3
MAEMTLDTLLTGAAALEEEKPNDNADGDYNRTGTIDIEQGQLIPESSMLSISDGPWLTDLWSSF